MRAAVAPSGPRPTTARSSTTLHPACRCPSSSLRACAPARRATACRAIELDFSDIDTQLSVAGIAMGILVGIGAPLWYINRVEADNDRLEELRALNRATFEQTGEYMTEVSAMAAMGKVRWWGVFGALGPRVRLPKWVVPALGASSGPACLPARGVDGHMWMADRWERPWSVLRPAGRDCQDQEAQVDRPQVSVRACHVGGLACMHGGCGDEQPWVAFA